MRQANRLKKRGRQLQPSGSVNDKNTFPLPTFGFAEYSFGFRGSFVEAQRLAMSTGDRVAVAKACKSERIFCKGLARIHMRELCKVR